MNVTKHRLMRVSNCCVNQHIRNQVVSIEGFRPANHFDVARIIVKLVNTDGSLGEEYLVKPSLLVNL